LMHPQDIPETQSYAGHSIMLTHWHYPDQAPSEDRPWGFLRTERLALRANPFMKLDQQLRQPFAALDFAVNLPPGGSPPAVDYSYLASQHTLQFTNAASGADLFYWTFGDQHASNEFAPTHKYWRTGTYDATLRASSPNSTMGNVSKSVSTDPDYFFFPLVEGHP